MSKFGNHRHRRRPIRRAGGGCEDREESLPEFTRIGAVTLFVLGLVLSYRFLCVFGVDGIEVVYHMLNQELGMTFALELAIVAVVVAGMVTVTGCVGYVGISSEGRNTMCIYLYLTCLLTLLAACMGTFCSWVDDRLGDRVNMETDAICDVSRHATLAVMLNCHNQGALHLNATAVREGCGEECKAQVEHIKEIGGCDLIEVLCHSYTYTPVGLGKCTLTEESSQIVVRNARNERIIEDCCIHACDQALQCAGYSYSRSDGRCRLLTPYVVTGMVWKPGEEHSRTAAHEMQHELSEGAGVDHVDKAHSETNAEPSIEQERVEGSPSPAEEEHEHEKHKHRESREETPEETREEQQRISRRISRKRQRLLNRCRSITWVEPAYHDNWTVDYLTNRYDFQEITGSTGLLDGYHCQRKLTTKTVLGETIVSTGLWLTISSFVTVLVLALATSCACVFQYHLIPRRVRKFQSRKRTFMQMLCPCRTLGKQSKRRMKGRSRDNDEYGYESWDSEASSGASELATNDSYGTSASESEDVR